MRGTQAEMTLATISGNKCGQWKWKLQVEKSFAIKRGKARELYNYKTVANCKRTSPLKMRKNHTKQEEADAANSSWNKRDWCKGNWMWPTQGKCNVTNFQDKNTKHGYFLVPSSHVRPLLASFSQGKRYSDLRQFSTLNSWITFYENKWTVFPSFLFKNLEECI